MSTKTSTATARQFVRVMGGRLSGTEAAAAVRAGERVSVAEVAAIVTDGTRKATRMGQRALQARLEALGAGPLAVTRVYRDKDGSPIEAHVTLWDDAAEGVARVGSFYWGRYTVTTLPGWVAIHYPDDALFIVQTFADLMEYGSDLPHGVGNGVAVCEGPAQRVLTVKECRDLAKAGTAPALIKGAPTIRYSVPGGWAGRYAAASEVGGPGLDVVQCYIDGRDAAVTANIPAQRWAA